MSDALSSDDIYNLRNGIVRGLVLDVDDTGAMQTVTVKTHLGVIHTGVEVWQAPGFSSVPQAGAEALLFAVGNDPSHFLALIAEPSRRMGRMAGGERGMYGPTGARVTIRQGGTVEILGGTLVKIVSPNVTIQATGTVSVTAPAILLNGPVTIGGALTVEGSITATGTIHGA